MSDVEDPESSKNDGLRSDIGKKKKLVPVFVTK